MSKIKYLSNPFNYLDFEYEGGTTLYHFNYSTHCWILINVLFFADSIEHAKEVLDRLFKLRLDWDSKMIEENSQYYNKTDKECLDILLANRDKWVITEAPKNQFFKVSWADNERILNF